MTGAASATPSRSTSAISAGPVAGVMQSSMPSGQATSPSTQAASAGSDSRASPVSAPRVTVPLWGMLSQESTVKGGAPASRRARSAASRMPKTVRGASGLAASAAISGWAASKASVRGSL